MRPFSGSGYLFPRHVFENRRSNERIRSPHSINSQEVSEIAGNYFDLGMASRIYWRCTAEIGTEELEQAVNVIAHTPTDIDPEYYPTWPIASSNYTTGYGEQSTSHPSVHSNYKTLFKTYSLALGRRCGLQVRSLAEQVNWSQPLQRPVIPCIYSRDDSIARLELHSGCT
jgi:hypothetical protein